MASPDGDAAAPGQPQPPAPRAGLGNSGEGIWRAVATTQQKLDQIAAGKTKTDRASPGTRLVREWNGKIHVITIDEHKAIHWNDRRWNSLSEVAREITGTRWSGPAFFGLKRKIAA